MPKLIKTAFEYITPESVEQGDAEEHGWIDRDGVDFSAPEYAEDDYGDPQTPVQAAIEWLRDKLSEGDGGYEASSSSFHPGIWYTAYKVSDPDYDDGEVNYSYHLEGWTPEEEREIYQGVMGRRANPYRADEEELVRDAYRFAKWLSEQPDLKERYGFESGRVKTLAMGRTVHMTVGVRGGGSYSMTIKPGGEVTSSAIPEVNYKNIYSLMGRSNPGWIAPVVSGVMWRAATTRTPGDPRLRTVQYVGGGMNAVVQGDGYGGVSIWLEDEQGNVKSSSQPVGSASEIEDIIAGWEGEFTGARRLTRGERNPGWPKGIEYTDTARDEAEAREILEGLKRQDGFLGGRVLAPSSSKPTWRVQAIFQDEPELSDEDVRYVEGQRRVFIPPSFMKHMERNPYIKGADLNDWQRKQVLSTYVNRHHAIGPGKTYANDQEWLLDHAFPFTADGKRLSRSHKYAVPHYVADELNQRRRNGRSYVVRGVRPPWNWEPKPGDVVYIEGVRTRLGVPPRDEPDMFPLRPPVHGTTDMAARNLKMVARIEPGGEMGHGRESNPGDRCSEAWTYYLINYYDRGGQSTGSSSFNLPSRAGLSAVKDKVSEDAPPEASYAMIYPEGGTKGFRYYLRTSNPGDGYSKTNVVAGAAKAGAQTRRAIKELARHGIWSKAVWARPDVRHIVVEEWALGSARKILDGIGVTVVGGESNPGQRSSQVDHSLASELAQFARDVYSRRAQHIKAVEDLMAKYRAKGKYDPEKAVKAYWYVIEGAWKEYKREYPGYHQITNGTKMEAARKLKRMVEEG